MKTLDEKTKTFMTDAWIRSFYHRAALGDKGAMRMVKMIVRAFQE